MPKIIGKSTIVVEHDGLVISELAGNVSTCTFDGCDTVSVAHVIVTEPTAEPWLTLDYDEWLCVKKGIIEMHYYKPASTEQQQGTEELVLTVNVGETCFIGKGERFRPVFPYGDAEYIATCIPAFKPERCIREEDTETSEVTKRLRELHSNNTKESSISNSNNNGGTKDTKMNNKTSFDKQIDNESDIIYHMCEKKLWDEAVLTKNAYYPTTYEIDGGFTHATAVPSRLIDTANHFYTSSTGEWICIKLSMNALHNVGIVTRFEHAKPVGTISTDSTWTEWACPHIFGGIPTMIDNIVLSTYPIIRNAETGQFITIEGLL